MEKIKTIIMEKLSRDIFISWIDSNIKYQFDIIDEICKDLDISPEDWFYDRFLRRDIRDYVGKDILLNMFDSFINYISRELGKTLIGFLPPKGYDIYNEPYYGIFILYEDGFYFDEEDTVAFLTLMKKLTAEQKLQLMENKIFSYIVNQTKVKIFSKKEVRMLKLRNIEKCSNL